MTVTDQPRVSGDTAIRESRSGVIERMSAILDAFDSGRETLRLEDITDRTGLPRSTTFRLACQLTELQWLIHDEQGYRLGARTRRLARITDCEDIRAAASAALSDLHVATGAVVHLGVLEGNTVHYLDKVGGALAATIPSKVGTRIDATQTVCGLALLASLAPEDADRVLRMPLRSSTVRPIARRRAVLADLYRVRQRNGLAVSLGTACEMGISTVAAPVLGPNGPIAAISVATRGELELRRVAPLVFTAARRTAAEMFVDGSLPGSTSRGARARLA
ncbi:IclR family transcriptional regulator [Nocardia tengchongensis]|uniref:IclR family transcriptional regulator n=1 Tax=Nocardia tengchongensis TaxID=2055889 RepID=UPI0036663EF1